MGAKNWEHLVLSAGSHEPGPKMCLLEAIAWQVGEPWSDKPACVSPTLAAFGRSWNDAMRSDQEREQLKQYIPLLINTSDPTLEEARGYMAIDWLCRVHTVAWLRLAKLDAEAQALVDHAPVVNRQTLASLMPLLNVAGAAARAAVGDAARDAAFDAARVAAWDTAGATAWDAAFDDAWDVAWDAAGAAAWGAARAAAGGAARAAAGDAAGGAARAAAGGAARAAAGAALEPTVKELQDSAHQLFKAMISLKGQPAGPVGPGHLF